MIIFTTVKQITLTKYYAPERFHNENDSDDS